jgi:hypothetical protein
MVQRYSFFFQPVLFRSFGQGRGGYADRDEDCHNQEYSSHVIFFLPGNGKGCIQHRPDNKLRVAFFLSGIYPAG